MYLKLMLIGIVILGSLMISEKGLLPEVPKRPQNPDLDAKIWPSYAWPLIVVLVVVVEILVLGVI